MSKTNQHGTIARGATPCAKCFYRDEAFRDSTQPIPQPCLGCDKDLIRKDEYYIAGPKKSAPLKESPTMGNIKKPSTQGRQAPAPPPTGQYFNPEHHESTK